MRGLLLLFFVTGIVSAVGMPSPHVSYHTKSGGLIEAGVTDISADMFRSMSPTSLNMMKRLLQSYQSYAETSESSEGEDFTSDDAYFAINGIKMQLKEALEKDSTERKILVNDALSSLKSVADWGYQEVLGYKYCLAMLCLHFQEDMNDSTKRDFFGSSWDRLDMRAYGLQLMSVAANPKSAGGDDDIDAASYLQSRK